MNLTRNYLPIRDVDVLLLFQLDLERRHMSALVGVDLPVIGSVGVNF